MNRNVATAPKPLTRQDAFVALLPTIEAHARAAFNRVRCPHDRDDAVAEVVAHAWEQFLSITHLNTISPEQLAVHAAVEAGNAKFTCSRCSE